MAVCYQWNPGLHAQPKGLDMAKPYCAIGCPDVNRDGSCPSWCSLSRLVDHRAVPKGPLREALPRIEPDPVMPWWRRLGWWLLDNVGLGRDSH